MLSDPPQPDTRKCCLLSQVLLEAGPGQRNCTSLDRVGHTSLQPRQWKGRRLQVGLAAALPAG